MLDANGTVLTYYSNSFRKFYSTSLGELCNCCSMHNVYVVQEDV